MYTYKSFWFFKKFFSKYVWKIEPTTQKIIYLTFDDGPTIGVTEKVLEILKQFNAKATFFLIGKNAILYPEIVTKILEEKHAIGNHTHNHLNGWKTKTKPYLENMTLAENILPVTNLFRPPYGKITKKQAHEIILKGYKIIMWDVLSYDFDPTVNYNTVVKKILKYTRNGSIIVFHDSKKAENTVLKILPYLLTIWKNENYSFEILK